MGVIFTIGKIRFVNFPPARGTDVLFGSGGFLFGLPTATACLDRWSIVNPPYKFYPGKTPFALPYVISIFLRLRGPPSDFLLFHRDHLVRWIGTDSLFRVMIFGWITGDSLWGYWLDLREFPLLWAKKINGRFTLGNIRICIRVGFDCRRFRGRRVLLA